MALRLVSLCPSITETLAEVGLGERLVGVTNFCTRPAAVVGVLPKVGGTKTVDLQRVAELRPDRIFANAEENVKAQVEALSARFPVHVSMPRAVAEIPAHIRELAREAGSPSSADAIAAEVENALAQLAPGRPAFRYAYFIWKDPWMTVSGDTYVSDLFRYAGGENVFADDAIRYPEVTPERVLAARPDVLFFSSEPYPFSEKHRPAIEAAFGSSIRSEFIDGDDCCWHGARTRQGLERMGELRARFA